MRGRVRRRGGFLGLRNPQKRVRARQLFKYPCPRDTSQWPRSLYAAIAKQYVRSRGRRSSTFGPLSSHRDGRNKAFSALDGTDREAAERRVLVVRKDVGAGLPHRLDDAVQGTRPAVSRQHIDPPPERQAENAVECQSGRAYARPGACADGVSRGNSASMPSRKERMSARSLKLPYKLTLRVSSSW